MDQRQPRPESDRGEVPEWSIGAVSKTVVPFTGYRGFESLPLRHFIFRHHSPSFKTPRRKPLATGNFNLYTFAVLRHNLSSDCGLDCGS